MSKTTAELDALKANWLKDPCWDLATTEGFEEYHSELDKFQDEQEAKWKAQREEKAHATFDSKKVAIEIALDGIDPIRLVTDIPAFLVAKEQVHATLLLAEQVKRVGDLLEEKIEEDLESRSLRLADLLAAALDSRSREFATKLYKTE